MVDARDPISLRRGVRLGKYRLQRPIGRGAFAWVWRARDLVEDRAVALKITFPSIAKEFGAAALEKEARLASRLDHPNIVAVRNADWIGGYFVIATDLAEKSLAQSPGARRSTRIALRILRDTAAGLAHAHEHRILHRDIKPENVLIFADGHAALGDFGVSRFAADVTRTCTEAGTMGYMAPEQAYGRPRMASDVFSLALIGYEMLTGTLPTWPFDWPPRSFDRFSAKVPAPVHAVFRRALSLRPDRRQPDAIAFLAELDRALAQAQSRQKRTPTRGRSRRGREPMPSPLAIQSEIFRRHHGSKLKLRFACHRCDGPIAESMRFCPWCGSADNSFAELTEYPLICPDCEHGVRPEWTACPWCYSGRFQGNGRAPRSDALATRACSRRGCTGRLRPFMRYCPLCKQKTRRPWSHPELHDRCQRCRWPVSHAFWRYCPWCGRRESGAASYQPARRAR